MLIATAVFIAAIVVAFLVPRVMGLYSAATAAVQFACGAIMLGIALYAPAGLGEIPGEEYLRLADACNQHDDDTINKACASAIADGTITFAERNKIDKAIEQYAIVAAFLPTPPE